MQCALLDPFIGSCKQDCWYLEQTAFKVSSLALKGIELFKNATRDVSASDTLPRERGSRAIPSPASAAVPLLFRSLHSGGPRRLLA
jgi:hypothetical protein